MGCKQNDFIDTFYESTKYEIRLRTFERSLNSVEEMYTERIKVHWSV